MLAAVGSARCAMMACADYSAIAERTWPTKFEMRTPRYTTPLPRC
ncbi:hypothetical protein [Methylobacterium sp. ID0610]